MKVRVTYCFTTQVRGFAEVDIPEGVSVEEWVKSVEGLARLEQHRDTCPQLDEMSGYNFDWVNGSDEPIQVEGACSDDADFKPFSAS